MLGPVSGFWFRTFWRSRAGWGLAGSWLPPAHGLSCRAWSFCIPPTLQRIVAHPIGFSCSAVINLHPRRRCLQIRTIRRKMVEIMAREATSCDLKELVGKLIPEAIGKEIEKSCQGVYPLQNTFVRKVKLLRAPKFDINKLMEVGGCDGRVGGRAGVR